MSKNTRTALLLGFIAAAIAVIFFWQAVSMQQTASLKEIRLFPNALALPEFSLLDESSREFNNDSLLGKWTLLFFGYTHCPDVCPITMSNMAAIVAKLTPTQQQNLQVVLVSVDPERDSASDLKTYVEFFNKNFKGVTGTHEQIQPFAKSLGAIYFKGEEDEKGNYPVDHSSKIFLVNPKGLRAGLLDGQKIPPATSYPLDLIAEDLINILKHY